MKIAVVTPVFGVQHVWLEQCLRSVMLQTVPRTHFVVCDGDDSFDLSPFPLTEVIRLPHPHRDSGNAARAIGTVSAISQEFDAVAYLDADNWFQPKHLELMVDLQQKTGAAVCSSSRYLFDLNDNLLGQCPEVDGQRFVDTNCMFLVRPAFPQIAVWYLMPRAQAPIGDRVLWNAIKKAKLPCAHHSTPTVNYRTRYIAHYRHFGKEAPGAAKDVQLIPDKTLLANSLGTTAHGSRREVPVIAQTTALNKETISLCLIVKNEANHLADCLRPIAGLVDEVVVVDTGSTDGTPKIAATWGAKVVHYDWQDSFADARNQSLQHATSKWIFWLDADDRVDAQNLARLRKLLGSLPSSNLAYMMKQRSILASGVASSVVIDHVRLFRKQPSVCWSYRVHEQILPALEYAKAEIVRTDIIIDHLGYHDPRLQQRKADRNLRLLLIEMKERPSDVFVLFNLACAYHAKSKYDQAIVALQRCLELAGPDISFLPKVYVQMAQCQRALGRMEQGMHYCLAGKQRFPTSAELWFEEGLLWQMQKKTLQAQHCFDQVLQLPSPPGASGIRVGLQSYFARHKLASVLAEQGKFLEAEDHWRKAVQECPEFSQGWLALARLMLCQNRSGEVDRLLEDLEQLPARKNIAIAMRATVHLSRKEYADAQRILKAEISQAPSAIELRLLLSECYLCEGRCVAEAEKQLREILVLDPRQKQAKIWLQRIHDEKQSVNPVPFII